MNWRRFSIFCVSFFFPALALAWGGGHDGVAELLCEFLPTEIRAGFTPEDLALVKEHCHYPDEPYKNLEEITEIIGPEDAGVLKSFGYSKSGWLHSYRGISVSFLLLRKAFHEKNYHNAAFYLSVLSHSVSDQGALNHTPILHFIINTRFEGITYGTKRTFDFFLVDGIHSKIQKQLQDWQPERLGETFTESVYALVLDNYSQGEMSSVVETDISFGTPEQAEDGMAKLVVSQLKTLLNATYSAWKFANSEEELTPAVFAEINHREEARRRQGTPENQAVFRGLFDENLNPAEPKATIGLVCEPFGSFHRLALSYVGKMLTASSGRTLRDHGFAIRPMNLWTLEKTELPDPKEMPILLLFAGSCDISKEIADTIRRYSERGGKLLYVAGKDPWNLTGMADLLVKRANDEVPVSALWAIQNEDVFGAMRITFSPKLPALSASEHRFRRNPNFDGFCKPICLFQIRETDAVEPLAWLANGRETFCVSARNGQAVWIPEYLILPLLFSDETTLRWTDMRLDSFGEKVLLETIPLCLEETP